MFDMTLNTPLVSTANIEQTQQTNINNIDIESVFTGSFINTCSMFMIFVLGSLLLTLNRYLVTRLEHNWLYLSGR